MSNDGIRLSQTTICWLTERSSMHAWWNHPRLNPAYAAEHAKEMDFGSALHAQILRHEDVVTVIDFADYRSHTAQEQRDTIRAGGKYPILAKDMKRFDQIVEATNLQLSHHRDVRDAFTGGEAEVKVLWTDEEFGVDCKARIDYARPHKLQIFDLKCTSGSAHPEAVSKRIFQMGYDVQGCFYRRAMRAAYGLDCEFYLVTVETEPPYCLSVVGLDPSAKWLGDKKCEEGMRLWRESIDTGVWPGYPLETCWATLPAWAEKQWLEHEMKEQ